MVLVTGCNSLTGQKLVEKLLTDGNKVRCFDFEKPGDLTKNVDFIEGDLTDIITLQKVCKDVDVIFHLQGMPIKNQHSRKVMNKNNVQGTQNIITIAHKLQVEHFYFLSSYEIYGKTKGSPTKPDDRKKPNTLYGKDILKAEKYCWEVQKKNQLPITIFRPARIIGPGTDDPLVLITLFMALGMDNANRLYLAGNGDNKFQLLHPEDAADAIFKAFKKGNTAGRIYNLGSDNVHTQMEQIVKIKETSQLDCEIKNLSPDFTKFLSIILKPFNIHYLTKEHVIMLLNNVLLDCQDVKQDLAWQPQHDNIQIMLETIEWYKKEKL